MTCRSEFPSRTFPAAKLAVFGMLAVSIPCLAAQIKGVPPPPSMQGGEQQPQGPPPEPHMPEAVRSAVGKVVVIAGRRPAGQEVGGTYDKDTDGLAGGMAKGSEIGRIRKQVGPVPVNIPIPILMIPGAIFGGLSGVTQRQIQEFRDALTEDLVAAENESITDDGLALDVFWGLKKVPDLDSKLYSPTTPVPEDTDAVLYVTFDNIAIDVQGKEAILTTTAEATLRGFGDGRALYETAISYQDRDTLRNWTENDNALWRDYANYSRHYLGRAVAADLFGLVELEHELAPVGTDSASPDRDDEWRFTSRSKAPTLAWNLALAGGEPNVPWADTIDESDIYYDVEIYDAHRIVYWEEQVPEPRHTLAMALECGDYRWSVRPAYRDRKSVV